MIASNINNFSSSTTSIKAKVDIFKGNTLVTTCTCSDFLEDFSVSRVGDLSKFFGFGICHKINTNLIDLHRALNLTKNNTLECKLGDGETWDNPFPVFYIDELDRDEDSNTITVTAYDRLYLATSHTISDLGLIPPYNLRSLAQAIANLLQVGIELDPLADWSLDYSEGGNFSGNETLRDLLDDIAEATQTIYFLDGNEILTFKRLDKDGESVFTIDRNMYYSAKTQTTKTLVGLCSVTDLGDNVEPAIVSIEGEGETQYIRNNSLLDLREDIGNILDAAIVAVGGLTICQFNCEWEGNHLLEIGDKISLTTEDGGSVDTFLLNDIIEYNGSLTEKTEWEYTADDGETSSNPTSLGEKLNQTFARVDKANQQIDLVASETAQLQSQMSSLQVTTEGITANVSELTTNVQENQDAVNESIAELYREVNLKMSAEEVNLAISSSFAEGVDKVTTTTGYKFDEDGLEVSKSDSEISTKITEDGMRIDKSGEEVLVANNQGVSAENLHATTYIIIGDNSRFENFGTERTACFWIGD